MVYADAIRKSPITRESVIVAQDVWRVRRSYLQGKLTRTSNDIVDISTAVITPIFPEILDNHTEIIIGMEIMCANSVPFLTTISRVVRFGSATEISNATIDNVVIVLKAVNTVYNRRGFKIVTATTDNGFLEPEDNIDFMQMGIVINLTAEDEHEPYI